METPNSDCIKALLAQKLLFGETLLYILRWKNERNDCHDRCNLLGSSNLHHFARQGGPNGEQYRAVSEILKV